MIYQHSARAFVYYPWHRTWMWSMIIPDSIPFWAEHCEFGPTACDLNQAAYFWCLKGEFYKFNDWIKQLPLTNINKTRLALIWARNANTAEGSIYDMDNF